MANRINREALFADESIRYRTPSRISAGVPVTFRFRTAKGNVSRVALMGKDFLKHMEPAGSRGNFDFFETSVPAGAEVFRYCFEICFESETLFFSRQGVTESAPNLQKFGFAVIPGMDVPEWAQGAVIYQIFIDRFCNGDPQNDVLDGEYFYAGHRVEKADWEDLPKTYDVFRFFGGDLQGVRKKLGYLKDLGVEVIYFNPLFLSPSNHRYDVQDYVYIDPHLTGFVHDEGEVLPPGSIDNTASSRYRTRVTDRENLEHANRVFADLMKEFHEAGLRVILDGVFNHCGSFHYWMDKERIYADRPDNPSGAAVSEDSPYHEFFEFLPGGTWPDNGNFLGWWNHGTLPKLMYEKSDLLRKTVLNIARKWVSPPYSADGWRLDVAADLGSSLDYNHQFWQEFRREVRKANPDALILAEHYGDPSPWLQGSEWDTVMNYDAFMEPVTYFLTGMEKHSKSYSPVLHGNGRAFQDTMLSRMARLPGASAMAAMNELSNHDHSRFLTRTNRTPGTLEESGSEAAEKDISYATFREGVVMQFTLPGSPTIYYGDEAGLTGWTDPDSRRPFPWDHIAWDILGFHKDMIRLRRRYDCLRNGSYLPFAGEYGFVSYGRFNDANAALILINHSDKERRVVQSVLPLGAAEEGTALRVLETNDAGYNIGRLQVPIRDGTLEVTVPAWSAAVYIITF